jgi:hypothetical protein
MAIIEVVRVAEIPLFEEVLVAKELERRAAVEEYVEQEQLLVR